MTSSGGAVLKLVIQDDEGHKTVVPFVRQEISIGRQVGNTIRLTERNVSRRHAKLLRENGAVVLEDLNSSNGTRVNGQRVQGRLALQEGDLIQIADYRLCLQPEEATQAQSHITPPPSIHPERAQGTTHAVATPHPSVAPSAEKQSPFAPPTIPRVTLSTYTNGAPAPSAARPSTPPSEGLPRIIVLNGRYAGREFACVGAEVTMGRGSENDIALRHRWLAPVHAKLILIGEGEWDIVGIQPGLTVNGEPAVSARLRSGDEFALGKMRFRFMGPGDSVELLPADPTKQRRNRMRAALLVVCLLGLALAVDRFVLTSQLASEQVERPIVAQAPADVGKAQNEPTAPPPIVTPSAKTEAPPAPAPSAAQVSPPTSEETSTDSSPVAGRSEDRAKKIRDLTRRPKDAPEPKVASNIVPDRADDSSAPGDQAQQLYEQGTEQFRKNQFPEAAATLKECIRLDPASARCHRVLGATYARLREPELGAEHYRKFIQLAPNDPETPKVRIFLEQYDAAKGLSKKD